MPAQSDGLAKSAELTIAGKSQPIQQIPLNISSVDPSFLAGHIAPGLDRGEGSGGGRGEGGTVLGELRTQTM